jgi:hypothetical protein
VQSWQAYPLQKGISGRVHTLLVITCVTNIITEDDEDDLNKAAGTQKRQVSCKACAAGTANVPDELHECSTNRR